MLANSFNCTLQGKRESQLDRNGYINGQNWSVAYVLDGFVETTPHLVDFVIQKLNNKLDKLDKFLSFEKLRNIVLQTLNSEVQGDGKASIAVVVSCNDQVSILTAGDTRVYTLHQRSRTIDHSRAQEQVALGRFSSETLNTNGFRKYLTRFLCEVNSEITLDEIKYSAVPCDGSFLICSDGFWSSFSSDDDIYNFNKETLTQHFKTLRDENFSDNTTVLFLTYL